MCGRLSQYSGIHDFVAVLSMPNALANSVGEALLERYNVAPTTQAPCSTFRMKPCTQT